MDLYSLNNTEIVQCTIYGEARGESLDGMAAVAWVIRNRVENPGWWGDSYQAVCLKPKQFSCFNHDDPNREKIIEGYSLKFANMIWKTCRLIAHGVIYDWIADLTDGANHYCHIAIAPDWTKDKEPIKVIGNHKFYLL